ncbi:MAG: stress response translation initiation inhibitor YciH [Candidatus Latescibacterota bacterium]|nr:stress response translation initiation inhibitor YciH [Candidatus Latescibacterota bacterium]
MSKKDTRLVYTTDPARCGVSESAFLSPGSRPRADGTVRVGRETKGRKGKGVTVVTGVPLGGKELDQLAKTLKVRCGAGGTVRDGTIEIQGEHRDTVLRELEGLGYTVKRSGG